MERTYPELSGEGGRARLVVLAAEVGRLSFFPRWQTPVPSRNPPSSEAEQRQLGIAVGVQCSLSAARALAVSLLDRHPTPGTGDMIPSAQRCCGTTGTRESLCGSLARDF